jgi:hypothetical protein
MKIAFLIMLVSYFSLTSYAQDIYSARKGLRLLPGHLHAVITVDSSTIHYQLFNHWYTDSYAQYRDLQVPITELGKFSIQNDTLCIIIRDKTVKLVDKRYDIETNVKHQKLCASVETMRKISYAYAIAEKHNQVKHYDLYLAEDLELPEAAFKRIADKNLAELLKRHSHNN